MTVSTSHPVLRAADDSGRAEAGVDVTYVADIVSGLSLEQKQLPSRYLYDPLGLALFEAICELPWYGLTRAERRLLATHGRDVFRRLPAVDEMVVLGSGNGEKVRVLLESRGSSPGPLTIELIDFSATALERSERTLSDLEGVTIVARQTTYEAGLDQRVARPHRGRLLALFLGSNIGNCDSAEAFALLDRLRRTLAPGDALVLGADLVKSEAALRLAYDDPLGVTAAFNRNLLVRINRELDADFDLSRFEHRMRWNAAESRVEMHLVSTISQEVRVGAAAAAVRFEPGESIWTESSYKYEPRQIVEMLDAAGFAARDQWIDAQDPFALTLAEAI